MVRICDHCRCRLEEDGDVTQVKFYGDGWRSEFDLCPTCTATVLAKCGPPC